MSLINQRNVKLLVFTFSLFNAVYFIYGLISVGFTPGALFDFFLFQWVLVVFYLLYVSSVKWFNERVDETTRQANSRFKETEKQLNSIVELVNVSQRALQSELKLVSANSEKHSNHLETIQEFIRKSDAVRNEILENIRAEVTVIKSSNEDLRKELMDLEKGLNDVAKVLNDMATASSSNNKMLSDLPSLLNKSANHISDSHSRNLEKQYGRIDALLAIYHFLDPNVPLPIMNDWAISSDYAHVLIGRFMANSQKTVVDVGSGISTLLLAYMAKLKGEGKVISLEHDESYKKQTEEQLKQHGVDQFASVHHCRIVSYEINGEEWLWYDTSRLDIESITLLSVDGPPGNLQKMSRYPAVPLLIDNLSKDADILLDDAYREDEKLISDRWVKEFGLDCRQFTTHKGTNCFTKL